MTVPITAQAERALSAGEVKNLINDKTVTAKRASDGAEWKTYFSSDGRGYTAGGPKGEWKVKANREHCVAWAKVRCAKITDQGNGVYVRMKRNGGILVLWTKITDGKDL